jgi:DNA-binding MarR family transcriptional regulator
MEESFHYLLMSTQSIVHRRLLELLKSTGLTIGQPKVLEFLSVHNGITQKELAAGCHIEAGSLTSLLNRMEDQGMIERRMLNGDRRTSHVFLTSYGEELSSAVKEAFSRLEDISLSGLSSQKREQFLLMFQQISKNLKEMEQTQL